ncbi:MAG: methyltransferase domain-containing protein [Actinomycetota bacterium]|nr:methyltransferase domain-containing protein [Actinomycetota bacterium]
MNWQNFLDIFHNRRAGITEEIFIRSRDKDGLNPYQWVERATPRRGEHLDLCCGSAPLFLNSKDLSVVRLDRSQGEIARAHQRGAEGLVNGDALSLPLRSNSFTSVTVSMALMLIQPLSDVIGEISRVMVQDAYLNIVLPGGGPFIGVGDLRIYRQIARYGGSNTLSFPNGRGVRTIRTEAAKVGLTESMDDKRTFVFTPRSIEEAELFIDSLYLKDLPDLDGERKTKEKIAQDILAKGSMKIPLRMLGFRKIS